VEAVTAKIILGLVALALCVLWWMADHKRDFVEADEDEDDEEWVRECELYEVRMLLHGRKAQRKRTNPIWKDVGTL
jgi:hypothetical protein